MKGIDPERYYTANVYLHYETQDRKKILSYMDIQGKHIDIFQQKVWSIGVKNVLETGTIELIGPLSIRKVLILPQDKKLNP
jgi:hypothetical protein